MKKFTSLTLSAAALMATAAAAPAFEFTGGSVGLNYSSSDVSGVTLDGFGYTADVAASVSDALSVGATLGTANYSTDEVPFDEDVTTFGVNLAYAVAPNASVGVFYDREALSLDGLPGEINVNVAGIEGRFDLSDTASVSGFWGKWSGKDIESSTSDIHSYGLRGDLALGQGFGLSLSYINDGTDDSDVHRTAFGASYDLAAAAGAPVLIEASYSTFDGSDLPESFSTFNIGVKYTFGGKTPAKPGFHGGHTASFDGPAIFF